MRSPARQARTSSAGASGVRVERGLVGRRRADVRDALARQRAARPARCGRGPERAGAGGSAPRALEAQAPVLGDRAQAAAEVERRAAVRARRARGSRRSRRGRPRARPPPARSASRRSDEPRERGRRARRARATSAPVAASAASTRVSSTSASSRSSASVAQRSFASAAGCRSRSAASSSFADARAREARVGCSRPRATSSPRSRQYARRLLAARDLEQRAHQPAAPRRPCRAARGGRARRRAGRARSRPGRSRCGRWPRRAPRRRAMLRGGRVAQVARPGLQVARVGRRGRARPSSGTPSRAQSAAQCASSASASRAQPVVDVQRRDRVAPSRHARGRAGRPSRARPRAARARRARREQPVDGRARAAVARPPRARHRVSSAEPRQEQLGRLVEALELHLADVLEREVPRPPASTTGARDEHLAAGRAARRRARRG